MKKMYQDKQEICIDIFSIPPHIQSSLASATVDMIKGILDQSNGREKLDKKICELGL